MCKFAVIIPVGPNNIEIERARDLLDSLFVYESRASAVVLIDDSKNNLRLNRQLNTLDACKMASVLNPLRGHGNGW